MCAAHPTRTPPTSKRRRPPAGADSEHGRRRPRASAAVPARVSSRSYARAGAAAGKVVAVLSRRTAIDDRPNSLARALAERAAAPDAGRPMIDLTLANPTV